MHIDLYIALAGLIVGCAVGLTGMGGGALMTPVLVLLFHVQPVAAVASDLVASLVMKPVGAAVHAGRGTVRWALVAWLAIASVPSAFLGVAFLKSVGDGREFRASSASRSAQCCSWPSPLSASRCTWIAAAGMPEEWTRRCLVKKVPTLAIGAPIGFIVGITSVGSGTWSSSCCCSCIRACAGLRWWALTSRRRYRWWVRRRSRTSCSATSSSD